MAGERKVGGEVTWQAFPLGHMDEDKSSAQGMMGQWVELLDNMPINLGTGLLNSGFR